MVDFFLGLFLLGVYGLEMGGTEVLELWHDYRASVAYVLAVLYVFFRWRQYHKSPIRPESLPMLPSKRPVKTFRRRHRTVKVQRLSFDQASVVLFYSTVTGSSKRLARIVEERIKDQCKDVLVLNLDELAEIDDYFVTPKSASHTIYLLILPSYAGESPLDSFLQSLEDTYYDFRVDSKPLKDLGGFSVFGLGDSEGWPGREFCSQAILADEWLGKLGAHRFQPIGYGDARKNPLERLNEWTDQVINGSGEDNSSNERNESSDDEQETDHTRTSTLTDVEDMGLIIKRASTLQPNSTPEMVAKDSLTYKNLTKQGYTIVGSHSGVKICRWTKSALRGRGSCYKYSFYGIQSHLCMETTPSLSCSNKCVFCWRHGTNPVGTTWKWQVDPPAAILEGAMKGHYSKIKSMKGVPGVRPERYQEAFRIRHCALSLVGEPIFYPHINEFVGMLHEREISSFLVCNAQHPTNLAALQQVTQLYVSIDASSRDSLKAIDRPLYKDFWERFQTCLDILREKKNQRTVFRLTLVKGFNIDEEVEGYADLVQKGTPCFVEVKGVTFCGTSKDGDSLTMANVPFYEEVVTFVKALENALHRRGLEYAIAAEHAHSCCVLIAHKRFHINGSWHTHIDYDRFFELLASGASFGPLDYTAPTPEWATFGAGGFNPADTRVDRKGRKIELTTNVSNCKL